MGKFMLFICAILSSAFIYAQSDCLSFYPSTEGSVLINKSYNANDDLLNVITYTVEDATQNVGGETIMIGCEITDAKGYTINKGKIEASCLDGSFFLKMKNEAVASDFFDILGCNTQLVGNFLDYPNTFADNALFDNTFSTDPGEYTVESKADKNEKMTVRVYDRQYQKNEKITTPAGVFDASKITFMFDSKKDKEVQTHKGVEWYAEGAGIVRSETYDKDGKLESYTVLTNLQSK